MKYTALMRAYKNWRGSRRFDQVMSRRRLGWLPWGLR